jgi:serine/threonine protein phosphatase 1
MHKPPRTLVVGDIHGHLVALEKVVKLAGLRPDDLLITLGDYVDRGPDSKGVLDWLIERDSPGRLIPLLGNHEQMMMDARTDPEMRELWLTNGGDTTLTSYGASPEPGDLDIVPHAHWKFLESRCIKLYEEERRFYVHAGAYPDRELDDQTDFVMLWARVEDTAPHQSGKKMICGHSPQQSGKPLVLEHAVCIDTWIFGGGWLTCLDVETGMYWQSDRHGLTRVGRLNEEDVR